MNFISEVTLISHKLNDGEERREYVALSEVKRLFDAHNTELIQEMEKKREDYFWVKPSVRELIDKAISACQKLVEEKNG